MHRSEDCESIVLPFPKYTSSEIALPPLHASSIVMNLKDVVRARGTLKKLAPKTGSADFGQSQVQNATTARQRTHHRTTAADAKSDKNALDDATVFRISCW